MVDGLLHVSCVSGFWKQGSHLSELDSSRLLSDSSSAEGRRDEPTYVFATPPQNDADSLKGETAWKQR
ncbi:hypothetical protein ACCO45_008487 [Purpureocillium lilacinum]|uniref:Uncharacterized protein n=1 Tax=Purpureocillium lilacinum TaxID=33203 RepID=A0ACC4DPV3_PURLI